MNQECSDLSYLTQNSIDALTCQAISDKEWILVFARKFLQAAAARIDADPVVPKLRFSDDVDD